MDVVRHFSGHANGLIFMSLFTLNIDQWNFKVLLRKVLLLTLLIIAFIFYFQSCVRTDNKIFHEFFHINPSKDVKNLDSYSDEIGIDASHWLAFECDDSTIEKITLKLQLTEDIYGTPGLSGGLNMRPTTWWDTAFINRTRPLHKKEKNLHWYLWYDKKNKKAYFLTFDT